MGNYVSEQLLLFFRAIGLGLCLGLLYDLLGALRRLGGRVWGGALDALFCLTAAVSVFLFVLAGDGELRIFMALGVVGGAVLFWCLPGPLLRPVWGFWLALALFPLRLVKGFVKKCLEAGKKVFSFCRNWVTMVLTKLREGLRPSRQEGEKTMERAGTPSKQSKPKKKAEKKKRSRLATLLILVLMTVLTVQIFRMFDQIRAAKAEEAVYAQQLSDLREANRQLQEDLDNSGSLDLIEDIARNELGMVSEGEKVFHFNR